MKIDLAAAYYGLVTGLPGLDLEKPVESVGENLANSYHDLLEPNDEQLVRAAYLPIDHENIIRRAYDEDPQFDHLGNFSPEQLEAIEKDPAEQLPYALEVWIQPEWPRQKAEQLLWNYYLSHCQTLGFPLLTDKLNIELSWKGIVTLQIGEMLGEDLLHHLLIPGGEEEAGAKELMQLTESTGLKKELESLLTEKNHEEREWKMDNLLWNWMEERLFMQTFSVHRLVIYAWQQQLVSRWWRIRNAKDANIESMIHEIRTQ